MLTKIKKKYLEFRHRNCYDDPCKVCNAAVMAFFDALLAMKYDTFQSERKRDSDG